MSPEDTDEQTISIFSHFTIGVVLATLLAIIYLYRLCFDTHEQTKIERASYGKNRKSVTEAVEEQKYKAHVITEYKKELDKVLQQVFLLSILFYFFSFKK